MTRYITSCTTKLKTNLLYNSVLLYNVDAALDPKRICLRLFKPVILDRNFFLNHLLRK